MANLVYCGFENNDWQWEEISVASVEANFEIKEYAVDSIKPSKIPPIVNLAASNISTTHSNVRNAIVL